MTKLKTAIVGTGKVADTHAEALVDLDESDFRAVFSRTFARAQAFAEKYGVRAYRDLSQMLDEEKIDVTVICTPHPAHAEAAVLAARSGSHILIEKPLASSLKDCDSMISEAADARVKLGMISQRRLYAPVRRIKDSIDAGKIGDPVLGIVTMLGWRDRAYYESDDWRGTWEGEGGGVLVNQAPHQLDLLQWLMGPISDLCGCWANLNHPYIEVEDTAVAVIHFKSGALGSIVVSNSQNPALYGKVAVFGGNGSAVSVQTDGGAMFVAGMSTITEPPVNDLWTIPGEEQMLEQWKREDTQFFSKIDATKYYHRLQIEDFLRAVLEGHDPMVTGEEGRKTVEIFEAIYRSEETQRPVRFPLSS